jgi:signal transduction histidine kinase
VSAFPSSSPPETEGDAVVFEEERPSVSELRTALPAVALLVRDQGLRHRLSVSMQSVGLVAVGEDILPAAVVIITDAPNGSQKAVTDLRARGRSDAAIIVVLGGSAPASEVHAAYESGALLCLRELDEDQLLAAIGSAIHLHQAKAHADDLMRQLDIHSHLAALGRVTANFTHELSNPLAALMMNFQSVRDQLEGLSTLRDLMAVAIRDGLPREIADRARPCLLGTTSGGDLRAGIDDMQSALDRIHGLLETVRSLSRGGLSSRIEEVDLATVLRDVRRWADKELAGVHVQELIDEPLLARADPRLLGQIVLNLVTNAAHAARQLPSPRVRLHVYGTPDTAIVSVRDNGPGVLPEIRDRIFEPFFTTRRAQGGTGLGLALCREYASQMQGRLTLWTVPGRGACFRVHLRRA